MTPFASLLNLESVPVLMMPYLQEVPFSPVGPLTTHMRSHAVDMMRLATARETCFDAVTRFDPEHDPSPARGVDADGLRER